MQPHRLVSERSKVAFLISLLSWNLSAALLTLLMPSLLTSRKSSPSLSTADQLIRLRQGTSSVCDYTLQSRTLAASCGWNEMVLITAYRQGLGPQIKIQTAIYDDNVGLESFMQKAERIFQRLTACQPDETAHSQASPAAFPPVPEHMQVDTNRLTLTERAQCLATGLCLYWGASGHFIQKTPSRPTRPAVSTLHIEPEISILPLWWQYDYSPLIIPVSIRPCGSSGNFISQNLLTRLDLGAQDRNHTRKTTWARAYQVSISPCHSACWLLPPWNHLLSGTGGTYRRHHPGMPLVQATFTRGQMGYQRDPAMEWILFPEVYL